MTLTQHKRKADRRRKARLRQETSRKKAVCILFAMLTSSSAMDWAGRTDWTDTRFDGDFGTEDRSPGFSGDAAADARAEREMRIQEAKEKKDDAKYGTGRYIKARLEAEQQARLKGAQVPGEGETADFLRKLCKEHDIDLTAIGYEERQPLERQVCRRFLKMGTTGAVAGGAYVGVGAATKAAALKTGAVHVALHQTANHKVGALVANTGVGLKGTVICGLNTLLPALAGAGAGFYTYNKIQTYFQRLDTENLQTFLFRIRQKGSLDSYRLNPAEQDKFIVRACIQTMLKTLNLAAIKTEFSGETSVFERAHQLDGMANWEDNLYNKCMPVQKIGAITHCIYHSPLVPIHETLSLLIGLAPTAHIKTILTSALLSPAIPLAGFPLAWAAFEAFQSMRPDILKDAAIALDMVQNMEAMERRDCGFNETMFFKYRERVHTSYDVLEHERFEGVFKIPGLLYKALQKLGVLHQCLGMPGPSYLDERVLAGEESLASYNVDATFLQDVAQFAEKEVKHVTVADLAAYRASKIGAERLLALANAIKGMAEPGHTESWTYEKLQEDMGMSFPTLVQRQEHIELLPAMLKNATGETYFDHNSQQGRIQAACFMYALATRGDVGCPLSASQFDKGYTWGAPRLTNAFLGSEVYYQNRRYRVEEKRCNGVDTIFVTLKPIDIEKFEQAKPITLSFVAEQRHEEARAHGGAHGMQAGGVMAAAGGLLTVGVGSVATLGGGVVVAGAAGAGAYAGSKIGAYADDTFCVVDLDKLHEFKVADVMNFHNYAAYIAWDTMFAPLGRCLNDLKAAFRSVGGVQHAEVVHSALKKQIVAEQATAAADAEMQGAGFWDQHPGCLQPVREDFYDAPRAEIAAAEIAAAAQVDQDHHQGHLLRNALQPVGMRLTNSEPNSRRVDYLDLATPRRLNHLDVTNML